ncbi:MAG: hypothetical protein WC479_11730 [Candidatus Izemoplasmatales bacterium]
MDENWGDLSDAAGWVTDTVTGDEGGSAWTSEDTGSSYTEPTDEANAAYDSLMAVGAGLLTEQPAAPSPAAETGPSFIQSNADGTFSIVESGRELGRYNDQGIAEEQYNYMFGPTAGPRNQSFEFNYGDERRTAQYDQYGYPIWKGWEEVNVGAPGKNFMSEEAWNAANPNYQAQTGWTPYWGYNEYLANINPMLPSMEQMYNYYGSYGGLQNVPDWIMNQAAGSPLNALTYFTPPPVTEGHPDYERMTRDITNYGKAFNVGGPSYTLPGGWMTMGPREFINTGLLALEEQNPSWYSDAMRAQGYVWNPYGGFYQGAPSEIPVGGASPPAVRRSGGGGGGGGSYTPLELKPGTPEYEAYFSRMPRINNVEWMPGR